MAQKKAVVKVETSDDLNHGQAVIVTARWILIVTGIVLTLWNPPDIGVLRLQVTVLILLAFFNFYLTTEMLRHKPTLQALVYIASVFDLGVITLIVMMQGGYPSGSFVFYFPAILAYSVAFHFFVNLLFTGGIVFLYFVIATVSMLSATESSTGGDFQVILSRLIVFVAIAFLGDRYRRIEFERRKAAAESRDLLAEQLKNRQTTDTAQS
jgi:hypothetical protein